MNLNLENPHQETEKIAVFVQGVLAQANKKKVVIAVSGGVDSVLALALLSRSLDKKNIFPTFLPYKNQDMDDAKLAAEFLKIPKNNWREIGIEPIVTRVEQLTEIKIEPQFANIAQIRLGNVMARSRMIIVYDLAKKLDALVCGTENKSDKYLGYFTRFGDEASDFEPLIHLYKTQLRQLAQFMNLPKVFSNKSASAGLWEGQTDEGELGFSYVQADPIMASFFEEKLSEKKIAKKLKLSPELVAKVLGRVRAMAFKHEVPYKI